MFGSTSQHAHGLQTREGHDAERNVEGDGDCGEHEQHSLRPAPLQTVLLLLRHAQQPREHEVGARQHECEDPDECDLAAGVATARGVVAEWISERDVAVDSDDGEVHDGGGGEEHVERVPCHAQVRRLAQIA